jgi:4-deoxy-L-threo-5-hexosulose-uronate ketol-isomerase
VYFYFDLEPEEVVFHFLGRPQETRSIVVEHEQAVFAPGDLVHFGAGTATFVSIWSMGGENRRIYDDMTDISLVELR